MNLSSDQGWSSGESTRLPPMWPGFNATVFVSSLNAPPQQTAKGGALRDETKTEEETTPLHMFKVPTDTIEKASGLIVFDKVPCHNIKQIRPTVPVSS